MWTIPTSLHRICDTWINATTSVHKSWSDVFHQVQHLIRNNFRVSNFMDIDSSLLELLWHSSSALSILINGTDIHSVIHSKWTITASYFLLSLKWIISEVTVRSILPLQHFSCASSSWNMGTPMDDLSCTGLLPPAAQSPFSGHPQLSTHNIVRELL